MYDGIYNYYTLVYFTALCWYNVPIQYLLYIHYVRYQTCTSYRTLVIQLDNNRFKITV